MKRTYVCTKCSQIFEDRFKYAIHCRWQHPKMIAPASEPQLAPSLRRLLDTIEEYASYAPDRFAAEGIPKNSLLNFLVGKTGKTKKNLLEEELLKLYQAGYICAGLGTVFILNKKALKLRPALQPASYDYYVDNDLFIFGLKEKFTLEELKKIYRRKAKILHPDMGMGGETEPFLRVHAAFERLRRRCVFERRD